MSAPNLVPEAMENCLSYSVLNYLKRLKNQAKVEFEKLIVTVGKPGLHSQIESIKLYQNPFSRRLHDLVVTFEDNHFAEPMQHNSKKNTEVMMVDDRCSSNEIIYLKTQKSLQAIRNEINEFPGFALRIKDKCKDPKPQCYKNPFDINRSNLIDQISRMRINFLQKNVHQIKMHTDEQLHSLPISQMGNYQDYLKKMQPSLRELEQQPVRQHMFGNPFKFDKKVQMMVDEADIDLVGNNGLGNKGKRNVGDINPNRAKRRPGPLPKDFTLQRPLSNLGSIGSPVINGSASPVYSPPPSPIVSNNENLLSSDEGEETNVFPVNLKLLPTSTSIVTPSINSVNSATGNINHSVSTSINCNVTGVVGTMNHNHSNTNHNHCLPVNDLSGSISDIENDCDAVQNKLQDNSIAPVNGLATSNGLFDLSPNDLQTRKTLFKLVRKPGRNYEQLTSLLAKSFGSARTYLLEQVIFEAGRFKRKALVEHLMAAFPTESVHFNNGV